ncbi:PsbP domain-containing protein [Haematococcus lacustris]|uniref:PsbP domain-containing protein n=1 Tax=Haematococcus lacustris TaxID=44745 RepID=A0A699ZFT6_HAELA|nr:PsbP domain-containing protein [Haematococcus lacustris]
MKWGGQQPSSRRFALSTLAGTAVALGGNLGGITTQLLGLDGGKLAERLQLDAVYPVRGLKRCVDGVYGFEFQYPASWLADQTVAYRAAQRAEASRALDMPPLARPPRQRPNVYEPVAAYGPAGSSGEENVSVIVAPIFEGFSLSAMGSPEKVATQFLATIAPEGSAKEAHLLSASMEYTVKGPNFARHNLSVITSK